MQNDALRDVGGGDTFNLFQSQTGFCGGVRSPKAGGDHPRGFRFLLLDLGQRGEAETGGFDRFFHGGLVNGRAFFQGEPGVGAGDEQLANAFLLLEGRTDLPVGASPAAGRLEGVHDNGFVGRGGDGQPDQPDKGCKGGPPGARRACYLWVHVYGGSVAATHRRPGGRIDGGHHGDLRPESPGFHQNRPAICDFLSKFIILSDKIQFPFGIRKIIVEQ
jgi:hypothetical protein